MAENRVLSFIDEVNKEKQKAASHQAYMNSPTYKKKVLNDNMTQARTDCLQYIFADLYKNSLPLDDSYIHANDEKLTNDMKDFINRQTANRGVDCYVREAIKKGNKSLAQMVESVDRLVNNCFREKVANCEKLDPRDLNWKFDNEKKEALDKISRDANLDEVSQYIRKNVKAAAEYEKGKIKERRESKKALEEEMKGNDELTSESAINRYMVMHGKTPLEKVVYQPSLFEAVMMHSFNINPSDTQEDQQNCYNEAVGEFTMLNINKALRVKDYSLSDMRSLARQYASA